MTGPRDDALELLAERADVALAGLLRFARAAIARGVDVPTEVSDLARALHAQALMTERVSEVGNGPVEVETIDGVRQYGTPDEAGTAVGLSGRRVRQLCANGLVVHRPIGSNRYLVNIADLQRYLSEAA